MFLELGSESRCKFGQRVSGDTFLSKLIKEEGRIVAVLSDGLGSGIKASVLSTLTSTMALKYMENQMNIEKAASVIMKTLPVCKIRRLSYATFTILDISSEGIVNAVEYDNPSLLYYSNNAFLDINKEEIKIKNSRNHLAKIYLSRFEIKKEDRLIFHSDGLNQSGMGKVGTPLGWGIEGVKYHISDMINKNQAISARSLARSLVEKALSNDGWRCGDDTTCGVVYVRQPRKLLILTGPPIEQKNDRELGATFKNFPGLKIICGGTTAKIIARELDKKVLVDLRNLHPEIPPISLMDGADLITEGIITLSKSLEYLELPDIHRKSKNNAAVKLVDLLLDSDEIVFLVGTKLNDANQVHSSKPIEIRHSIIRKMATILEEKYLKKIDVKFI
jgi:hypothetical protein